MNSPIHHQLIKAIGVKSTSRLMELYGGGRIYIPADAESADQLEVFVQACWGQHDRHPETMRKLLIGWHIKQ